MARYDENSRVDSLGPPVPAVSRTSMRRNRRLDADPRPPHGLATVSSRSARSGCRICTEVPTGSSTTTPGSRSRQLTVGFKTDIQLFRGATLTVGGRYQTHSLFGGYFVPKAGLVVRATEHLVLRASYGHGFRAPDLGQLYYRFANPASFYQVIGNPTLEPETSRSYNAGAVYTRSRFRLGLSLYRNDVRDLVESLFVGTPRTPAELETIEQQYGIPSTFNPLLGRQMFIDQNLNRIYSRGLEVDGEASLGQWVPGPGRLHVPSKPGTRDRRVLTQRNRHHGVLVRRIFPSPLGTAAEPEPRTCSAATC